MCLCPSIRPAPAVRYSLRQAIASRWNRAHVLLGRLPNRNDWWQATNGQNNSLHQSLSSSVSVLHSIA
jgi:hypothetical protein